MAVVVNGDVITVKFFNRLDAQLGLNVRWARIGSVVGAPTLQMIADQLDLDFGPLYKTWLGTAAEYVRTEVQRQSIPFTDVAVANGSAGVGTAGLNDVGAQVSGCLTLTTGFGGRQNRGRMYLPFPGHDMVDPPFGLTGAGMTAMNAFGTELSAPSPVIDGADECLVHWAIYRFPPITLRADITGFRSNDKLATQRRRGAYGRPNVF